MHEIGYCEALLPVVDARALGRPVDGIGIRAGVRHGLMGDVMQMAWQMVAEDTPYAGATTHLEAMIMDARCTVCGHQYRTGDTLSQCPACGAMGAQLTGGDEFGLAWLSYTDEIAGTERVLGSAAEIYVDMSGHTHADHDHGHVGGH